MIPIDFQGQGSNDRVTMDLTLKKLVNRIKDKAIIIEASNLSQMFPMDRR